MNDHERRALEIEALRAQLQDIEEVLPVLERLQRVSHRGRRGRRSMGAAERAAVSARIKRYWKDFMPQEQKAALSRLLELAQGDSGQSRRVADFLLAWHNAQQNGGWDPTDLWAFDPPIVDDILTVLTLIARGHNGKYPNDLGFRKQIEAVWDYWRGKHDAPPDDD
jgi:hypothetical protein